VIRVNRVSRAWKSHLEVFLVPKCFEFSDDAWVIRISEAGWADQGLFGLIFNAFSRSIPMNTELKSSIQERGSVSEVQSIFNADGTASPIRGVKPRKVTGFATDRAIGGKAFVKEELPPKGY
jgi:hypothetical protein